MPSKWRPYWESDPKRFASKQQCLVFVASVQCEDGCSTQGPKFLERRGEDRVGRAARRPDSFVVLEVVVDEHAEVRRPIDGRDAADGLSRRGAYLIRRRLSHHVATLQFSELLGIDPTGATFDDDDRFAVQHEDQTARDGPYVTLERSGGVGRGLGGSLKFLERSRHATIRKSFGHAPRARMQTVNPWHVHSKNVAADA